MAKPLPVFTAEHAKSIVTQLGACLVVQRTYGKQGSDLEAMARVFIEDLRAFEPDKVVKALGEWRLKSSEFPTPADIKNLISPQPVWSAVVYQELIDRRKKGEIMGYEESEYIKGYKNYAMRGL